MTLAPSTTRGGTAGVNRFTPDQLLRTARLFATDPDLERHVDLTATERQWAVLDSTPHLQIWLLTWPEGTGTGWHDHVDSAGAFLTVRGHLLEQSWHGRRAESRSLKAGDGRSFGSRHVHNVANAGVGTALSIHLYTPRLSAMTRYAVTPDGLQAKGIERAGVDW